MEEDDCFEMLLALADEAGPKQTAEASKVSSRESPRPRGPQQASVSGSQRHTLLPPIPMDKPSKESIITEPSSRLRVKSPNLTMHELKMRMAALRFRGLDELGLMTEGGEGEGWVTVKKGRDGQPALSISSDLQLIRIGTSADFGFCQGRRRDGQPCKNTVNKSICAFCDYHVQGEYRKLRSARGGFSDSMLQTGIRSSQTGGQPGKALSRTLPLPGSRTGGLPRQLQPPATRQQPSQPHARCLARADNKPATASQGSKRGHQHMQAEPGTGPGSELVELESDGEDTGRDGLPMSDVAAAAQRKAFAIIQARGGLTKPDPNDSRPKRPRKQPPVPKSAPARLASAAPSPAAPMPWRIEIPGAAMHRTAAIDRMTATTTARPAPPRPGESAAQKPLPAQRGKENVDSERPSSRQHPPAKLAEPQSGFAAAFGAALEGSAPSATGTRYKQLVEDADYDKLQAHLSVAAKKEEIASRAESLTKLTVKAMQCETCGWMGERRRPECAGHQVKPIQAVKRWWVCGHCSHRLATVALRYPSKRCPK
ncbi:hypothetical protein WJX84_010403 [Apatococcus fuscideae]|uniref:Protein MCM10 homolog n=1 Tax=Apatococcus fuscideae TaxID=2026836 RepID=A0AAW1TA32_9CHLO